MEKGTLEHIKTALENNDTKSFEETLNRLSKDELYEFRDMLSSESEGGSAQSASNNIRYNDGFSTACNNAQVHEIKSYPSLSKSDDFSQACKTALPSNNYTSNDLFSNVCYDTHNNESENIDHNQKTFTHKR